MSECSYKENYVIQMIIIHNVFVSLFFRQPWFGDWGFNLKRGEDMLQKWNLIPENTDILITHGPPVGKIF